MVSTSSQYHLFRLGLSSDSLGVGLGEGLGLALLAVLYPTEDVPLVKSAWLSHDAGSGDRKTTNLPLGETQVHLATALSGDTRAFLEGAADRAGGDGQVTVVAG